MKNALLSPYLLLSLLCVVFVNSLDAQFAFTNSNSLLSIPSIKSGCAVTVVDVNNDGLDDILRMDQSTNLHLELQQQNGTFSPTDLGNISSSGVWAMAAADVDHNGWKDIVTGTYGSCYLVKLFYSGGVVSSTTTLLSGSYFVQNITFGDINNDGWVDVFVCDDNAEPKIYKNDGAGNLNLDATLINTIVSPGVFYNGDPADSGNYGSVWTDFDGDGDMDLFVAHCRQSTSSSTDLRRKDRLFVNDGNNNYTESGSTYGIEVTDFKQTWTASFGDIDNDGDLDLMETCHGESGLILENNGTGVFTDITSTTGFTTNFDPIESILEDFDNDGYLDILISGGQWVMWHNNGNKTFTQVFGVFADNSGMLSFATGDLNHDGAIDLYASYGYIYNSPGTYDDVLYLNNKNNSNHFITFDLKGTTSNKDAIGARATIFGAFGKQVREIRSGETYGTSNSFQLHFGLGANTTIDSARIDWPAGGKTTFSLLNANQFVTVVENGCTITDNTISGSPVLCGSQPLTLSAPSGYTAYSWSNASTTPSISVSTAGVFNVMVTNSANCTNISPTVNVLVNPNETPTITVVGQLTTCQGNVTLTSTPAISYSWTGPNNFTSSSQSIMPAQSGTYSLTVQGQCGSFAATPVTLNITPVPNPVVTGAFGIGPASFNLSATGTGTVSWYDQATGGTLLTTGNSYTTPVITNSTTYYVENTTVYPGAINYTGQPYHTGTSDYSGNSTNGSVDFNVLKACTLKTVKVYTDSAGLRNIQLRDFNGTLLNSLLVNIPVDSTVITLNFPLIPGTNYSLTTDGTLNTSNFGDVSPLLKRSNSGVNYSYTINDVISLTGSNQGASYYYYFYDWQIQEEDMLCTSSRVPVTASVSALGVNSLTENMGLHVYPNPVNEMINIVFENDLNKLTTVELTDVTGRVVESWSFEKVLHGQPIHLNVSGKSAGTYFMSIKSESNCYVQKLILTN